VLGGGAAAGKDQGADDDLMIALEHGVNVDVTIRRQGPLSSIKVLDMKLPLFPPAPASSKVLFLPAKRSERRTEIRINEKANLARSLLLLFPARFATERSVGSRNAIAFEDVLRAQGGRVLAIVLVLRGPLRTLWQTAGLGDERRVRGRVEAAGYALVRAGKGSARHTSALIAQTRVLTGVLARATRSPRGARGPRSRARTAITWLRWRHNKALFSQLASPPFAPVWARFLLVAGTIWDPPFSAKALARSPLLHDGRCARNRPRGT